MADHSHGCITCDGILVERRFVEAWVDGKPLEVSTDLYCTNCKTRWLAQRIDDIDAYNKVQSGANDRLVSSGSLL
ncbi:MAG: hypothetical protein JRN62_03035 [Nitrososphaerota archaeon]|jgi:hypothetical protein|nr:hypothetical protein [Nitrososphaerota archaeon]MDG6948968.1 hypothetical protein [Nitrososphaerota archaeon]